MKAFRKIFFISLVLSLFVFALSSCALFGTETAKSAYDIAVENGFEGTEAEWLESLKGEDGKDGEDAYSKSAYDIAVENGFVGTEAEWLASLKASGSSNGKSSYELAVENGFVGTEKEWLDSLNGKNGNDGVGIESISIDHQGYVHITLSNGKTFDIKVEDYCYHEDTTALVTSPTCTSRGYTTNICNDCGFVLVNAYTEKIGHHFVDKKCNICGEEEKFGYITVDTGWYVDSGASFIITTREQLAGISYLVSNGNTFSGKTIILGNDIDLGDEEWIPIGTESVSFAGTFDGHEYTISNLKISEQKSYVGLFGNVSGTVKRLNITNANVMSDGANSYIAIACGYCSGNAEQISVSGYVTASDSLYVGGVIGQSSFAGSKTLTGLVNKADIIGRDYTGGICGRIYGHFNKDSDHILSISIFENFGEIIGAAYTGGICGSIDLDNSNNGNNIGLTATDLVNSGNVTGNAYVGGLLGYAQADKIGAIFDSSSSAEIEGEYYVGGLVGYLGSISLNNCDNTGSHITANDYLTESGYYYAYLGGYVGYGYEVIGCANFSNITYVSKGDYVGGIAGYLSYRADDCENTGVITASDSNYVGGLVGKIGFRGNNTVTNCINRGKVVGNDCVGGLFGNLCGCYDIDADHVLNFYLSDNHGEIVGHDYVGGLSGKVYLNNSNNSNNIKLTATDLVNGGNVTGNAYVGGLFGYAQADKVGAISDSSSSAKIEGEYYVGGLVGYLVSTSLNNCDNTGTEIVANDYLTSDGMYYAYLGGYVGYGYEVIGCANSSNITYVSKGDYVGGIAGYLSYRADNCENTGVITASDSNYVGGLVGMIGFAGNNTVTNCINRGKVEGNNYVGGLFGNLSGNYNIDADHTLNLQLCENHGEIVGHDYVGGLSGKVYLNNSNNSNNIGLTATDLVNGGNVTGNAYVGGLFGYAQADKGGTLIDYSSTGTVKGNENSNAVIGYNTSITVQ